ncbi:MAG: iron chelate uptake ABC transporter family permease subunit [Chlamydiales bacterium]|nr:iron ABC transporter permease [Chlamydiales bacterium]NCF70981.1 iron chelate uptake ABC transporter family permease subunit [Chlamydiales bacterium]
MHQYKYISYYILFSVLILSSLLSGPSSLEEIYSSSIERFYGRINWAPLLDERLPRLIICLLTGASLASSGTVMQALFKNPLASPSVLGCSFAASFLVSLVFASQLHLVYPFLTPLASIIGCVLSLFLVYRMSYKKGKLELNLMILSGIACSTVFISLQNVLLYLLRNNWHLLQSITEWSNGQIHNLTWRHVHLQMPLAIIGLSTCLKYKKELNLLSISEQEASILGVDVPMTRFRLLFAVSILTGGSVASCGIISFFCLMVPHILRGIFGPNNQLLLPMSILWGGFALAFLDLLLKISKIQIFSIGNITAVLGGVFFLALLYQQKQKHSFT